MKVWSDREWEKAARSKVASTEMFNTNSLIVKRRKGCAPAAGKLVGGFEGFDEGGLFQNFADGFALDADAFAVDYPHEAKAFFMRFFEIGNRDGFNIARRKRVKVDRIGDLQFKRIAERIF